MTTTIGVIVLIAIWIGWMAWIETWRERGE